MERISAKYRSLKKQLTKVVFSQVFSLLKMIRNGIQSLFCSENDLEQDSEVFLFRKWFGTEFRGFSQLKMVRNGIPRGFIFREKFGTELRWFFSSEKWFGTEFRWCFSSENWFGTEFREFFSSEKWFGTEFRAFSLPQNWRNFDGTAVCSDLFRILRNNYFVGKWQPYFTQT
jgi:hypothetical protein